ncbi:response regulator [Aliivibrio finisterrensis]|uniref:Response regulator n=1 Tax=Aliivibrio finisterrensis TaxID=511998 RepID=A0A6N6RSI7_9GAMM|nr:response regulator [Aliivibrio finisterrensis]KAB2824502.1 response regulator [Aliivibrio finisterrensis]
MSIEQCEKNVDEVKAPVEDLLFNKDVLIVDDDPVFRCMVKAVLESYSCNVKEACNGLEGLKILQNALPDVLLCDLAMPILNGIEFVEEAVLEYPMLPIIVISGTGDMQDVAKVLRLGAKDFLVKPINDISILIKSLVSALKLSEESSQRMQDFSSQWFRTSELDKSCNDEFHWHLEHLQNEPNIGRELLFELLPESDAQHGDWKLGYRLLQSTDVMPLIFDYEWLLDGRLFFYLVDSNTGGESSVVSCLLIRAFFNDLIRDQNITLNTIPKMVASIEKGMTAMAHSSPMSGMFGYVDFADEAIFILSAGLDAVWDNQKERSVVRGSEQLTQGAENNKVHRFPIAQQNSLLLNSLGCSSFKLELSSS